jgi:hypothetical protein
MTNVAEVGAVARRLPQWVYKARDAAEFSKHIPRNSPIASTVHVLMGVGAAAAITVGGAAMLPAEHDPDNPGGYTRDEWLHTSRGYTTAAGALSVLITAGMQFNTPQHVPLGRGINPMYFLGVGMFAWSNFALPKIQQAYAE